MAKKLHLRVITPMHSVFEGEVDKVTARAYEGEMAVLPGHMPITVTLSYGKMKITQGDEEKKMAVLGGLMEVRDNRVVVVSEVAEWADEIDVVLARENREKAERSMKELTERADLRRAELQFRRASVLIEVSAYAVVKGRIP